MAEEMISHMGGFSPYESWKVSEITSRRPSGTAVTGVVIASVAAALGVGAWIFGPIFSNAKANGVRDLANAQFNANNAQIASLASLLGTERAERVAQGVTISQSITDSISGQQSSNLTAQQAAELSSIQSVEQNLLNQAVLGNLAQAPQKVAIYQDAMPCGCNHCNG
jgi:hypothetical protein